MKACPTCNRTYPDDTLAFCLMDGSVLSAPYDTEQKRPGVNARDMSPPRTELMVPPAGEQLTPTRAAVESPKLDPTITSSSPHVLPFEQTTTSEHSLSSTQTQSQANSWLWAVLVLVAVIVVVLILKFI